jgi:hypothetical protein
MEPSKLQFHNCSEFGRLDGTRDGSVLVERQMNARSSVIFEVRPQDAAQSSFAENDDVIKALPPNGADQIAPQKRSARATAEPSAPRGCPSRVLSHATARRASIAISKQIPGCIVPWKCLHELLRCPFGCGMGSHREVERLPAIV